MNPNALFLIILAVLLTCFFAGRRAGLVRTLIPIASAIAAFCLLAITVPVFRADVTDYLVGLQLTDAVVSAAAFIVTFLILRWLIKAVLRFFRLIGDAPLISSLNRALGGIAGFVGGLIIVWGTFFFLLIFFGPDGLPDFFDAINGNEFVKLLYNNNPVMTLINYFIFSS